jgi:ribose-phosphate pyrophosphokinase
MTSVGADEIRIFAGSTSPKLARAICAYLGVAPAACETKRFSDGNLFVRVLENVRGRRVYVVQSTVFPTNDAFMELLFWIDALKRASAESVTVVMPYFSYAKGDKKDEPRVSIRSRVCADAIEAAGADRVVALDLHAPQIQGFFKIPVDGLQALPVLCEAVARLRLRDLVVVAPDAGFAKQARRYASRLDAPLAIADKRRGGHDERAEVLAIIGEVSGRTALIVDDFTISAGTLADAAAKLVERGAREVYAAVTHGVFAAGSMERIERSPIRRLLVTDSIETQPVALSARVEVVSVAPLLGEAIRRIHRRESISVLFDG